MKGIHLHQLRSASPSYHLRRYVRAYAQRDVYGEPKAIVQPVPASLEHILEFEFKRPPEIEFQDGRHIIAYQTALVGPHTVPNARVFLAGAVQSFAIFFEPFGLWQLFRVPNRELTDRFYCASDLLGPGIRQLWLALADCRTFGQRVASVERYLSVQALRPSAQTPIMRAAAHLFEQKGAVSIEQLSNGCGLSMRHFERRFQESTGLGPKRFGRITRFQMALDYKISKPKRSWLSIAHQFGYHDQMHMIRDFHRLGGGSPAAMLSELGDTRPPALAESTLSPDQRRSFD
jgi:AraC-like DNA-binding protein